MSLSSRRAVTLPELMVVMAITGLLAALVMPALQSARTAARRARSRSNLSRLAGAAQKYEQAHLVYPPGVRDTQQPIVSRADGMHHSWLIELLPYLDRPNVYRGIDRDLSVYSQNNRTARELSIPDFRCPIQSSVASAASGYAGVHHGGESPIDEGNNGMLFLNSEIRYDDVTDGLAYTALAGEKLVERGDLGWMSGTRATLRNMGHALANDVDAPPNRAADFVGGFGSPHVGGVHFVLADGRVRFISLATSLQVLAQLGNRADNISD